MISALIMIICGFVIGGIPTGYWVAKRLKGIDIRECGSGSTGATNVWRCVGKGAGVFVFVVDVLKGVVPVVVARYLNATSESTHWNFVYPYLIPALVAVGALVGHSKSVFLNFQGGKSAATGLGTLCALCPLGGLLTFITWLALVKWPGYVSLASILGVFSCPFWFALFHAPPAYVGYCVIGFLYVTYRHKANVKRLIAGTEPKFGAKIPEGEAKSERHEKSTDSEPEQSRHDSSSDSEPQQSRRNSSADSETKAPK